MDKEIIYNQICNHVKISFEEFTCFIKLFKLISLKKGEFHYVAGKVPRYWSFTIKGCLREYYLDELGDEKISQFYEENTWVGDVESMITQKPTDMNLQALEDCELFCITGEDMCDAAKMPWIQDWTIKKSFADNTALVEHHNRFKSSTPETLYLEVLNERPSLILRVPHHYIANYLGIRKETLSRVRNKVAHY